LRAKRFRRRAAGYALAAMTVVPLQVPGVDPDRLLHDWRPGAWIGAVRQAVGRTTELSSTPQGELVEVHPPQWLVALWPPQQLQQPFLGRWPCWASLAPGEAEPEAVLALLPQLPERAALWVLHEDLDWALMAEIVLLGEPALQPFQQRGLREFVESERAATLARIRSAYSPSQDAPACGPLVRTHATVRPSLR